MAPWQDSDHLRTCGGKDGGCVPSNGTVCADGVARENSLLYEAVAQLEADLQ